MISRIRKWFSDRGYVSGKSFHGEMARLVGEVRRELDGMERRIEINMINGERFVLCCGCGYVVLKEVAREVRFSEVGAGVNSEAAMWYCRRCWPGYDLEESGVDGKKRRYIKVGGGYKEVKV